MIKQKSFKRPVVRFIILSNMIFLPLFLLVGVTKILGFPSIVFDIMLCISSWSSTFAFIILFKKIYPKQNFIEYVKDKFNTKIKFSVIFLAALIEVLIFIVIIFILESKNSSKNYIFAISSLGIWPYSFLKNLLAGPLGEELGWRGFALNELQKKHSPLVASIIIGFWWGAWHLPTWFTTGFTGFDLIKYIMFFMISIISISIMITVFYNLNKNLLIPILIHQLFNFFNGIINGDLIDIIMYCAILYFVVAVILIAVNPKKVLY